MAQRADRPVRRHRPQPRAGGPVPRAPGLRRAPARRAESEALCRQALKLIEVLFGCDHPRTGWALMGLALARERAGDVAGAEAVLRRARVNWSRLGHADRAAA